MPDHSDAAERYGERVLGAASTAEERSLAAIAEVSDGWTHLVLGRLALQRGWRCWEVGAGSGTVATWLAGLDPKSWTRVVITPRLAAY